jgi:hypothetical protein
VNNQTVWYLPWKTTQQQKCVDDSIINKLDEPQRHYAVCTKMVSKGYTSRAPFTWQSQDNKTTVKENWWVIARFLGSGCHSKGTTGGVFRSDRMHHTCPDCGGNYRNLHMY